MKKRKQECPAASPAQAPNDEVFFSLFFGCYPKASKQTARFNVMPRWRSTGPSGTHTCRSSILYRTVRPVWLVLVDSGTSKAKTQYFRKAIVKIMVLHIMQNVDYCIPYYHLGCICSEWYSVWILYLYQRWKSQQGTAVTHNTQWNC